MAGLLAGPPSLCAGNEEAFLETYADIAVAVYEDSLAGAEALRREIGALTNAPSHARLKRAKEPWTQARQPYLQSETFRFSGGPIDDEDGPEPFLNAWPMDESYVDYVRGAPQSGIINDPAVFPDINPERLLLLNERQGEVAISCGYHAVEFLLWGQDLDPSGPGRRPVSDYTVHPHAERRKLYLETCADLLVRHLKGLVAEWSPGMENRFRASFLANPEGRSTRNVVQGLKVFSGKEMAGERLLVAWDTQDQEDEHSCFSDTTNQDVIYDAIGIRNLIQGRYVRSDGSRVEGIGLARWVASFDPELAASLSREAEHAVERARAIPSPFDQAILGTESDPGPKSILACVEAFEDLSASLGRLEQILYRRKAD